MSCGSGFQPRFPKCVVEFPSSRKTPPDAAGDPSPPAIQADPIYADDRLYASTALIYRPTGPVRSAMREWWHHKTRYCLHDQLALPYVLWRHEVVHNVIEESVYDQVRWEYSRPRGV